MAEDFNKTKVDISGANTKMVEQWAVIVMDRWFMALEAYGIGKTRALQWSFQRQIIKADGDVEAVIFKFLKYGRFVDMGAGRGHSLSERKLIRKFDRYKNTHGQMTGPILRKKKPWYTRTFYREVAKLTDLYKANYSDNLVKAIESSLTGDLNLNV